MFESSFGVRLIEGKVKGKAEEEIDATRYIVLKMARKGIVIETIVEIIGLTKAKIESTSERR
jgi:chemotaxis signal transduction protein